AVVRKGTLSSAALSAQRGAGQLSEGLWRWGVRGGDSSSRAGLLRPLLPFPDGVRPTAVHVGGETQCMDPRREHGIALALPPAGQWDTVADRSFWKLRSRHCGGHRPVPAVPRAVSLCAPGAQAEV